MRVTSIVGALGMTMLAGSALATPIINGAVVHTRVFNDAPLSQVNVTNTYPSLISISDTVTPNVPPSGFANRHNFHLSADGGSTDAVFNNGDGFSFSSSVMISGNSHSEGGLQISPWWSQNVDGTFAVIPANGGEIAAFGGRLPFYSFTASQGLHYALGDTVRMGMIYNPNGLSAASPATIEYLYSDGSGPHSSGPIAFDMGNAAEGHGTFGMLDDARVGGYFQPQISGGPGTIVFGNMTFVPAPSGLALLGLAGLALRRRR